MNIEQFVQHNKAEIPEFHQNDLVDRKSQQVEAWFNAREAACQGDADLKRLYGQLVDSCYNYTAIVCDFERLAKAGDFQALDQLDEMRGRVHDATIDAFKILARNMAAKGLDNSWIGALSGRVAYGELAISKTLLDAAKYQAEQEEFERKE